VWGFLKYYHPVVAKGSIDWDMEYMTRVQTLSSLTTKQQVSAYYLNWINSLGKIKRCKSCDLDTAGKFTRNLNLGWLSDGAMFTDSLVSSLNYIVQNRNRESNYYVTAVAYTGNANFETEKPYRDSIYPSAQMRLLALARYWNMIEYFFPYKYAIGSDWNETLTDMIPLFATAKDTLAYYQAMWQLTARVNDSHAQARFGTRYVYQFFGAKYPPFQFKIIDNKAVVTGFYSDSICKANDIRRGDVFLTIGNKPVAEIIKERSKYIGASNEPTRLRNFTHYALFNGNEDSVVTTFDRNGVVTQKTIPRYDFNMLTYKQNYAKKVDTFKRLDGNIGYINMGLLTQRQVGAVMNQLVQTRAIIFDVRNYPKGTMYQIARFLNADTKVFVRFTAPDLVYPGVFLYDNPITCGTYNRDHYTGKVILLMNEETQSHAEFTLMALQTAPNVVGIGSQTAGADGNVSLITFPGGNKVYMTGLGVYYPDGRETQRIGIVPDIHVEPTIEGIRQGRDEVLEKALEIINVQ
jgi:carboxyl-terminal processing protease